ncbi:hypothetical protein [Actinomadura rupiterrae]|uniref:hypothetical protein n=1 Tax=Actinomadura rupiterrae TaxID=559627 RepID=UPI0020A2906F|nr:hypothetical protein [Actinomadura rupiterrae]MCP2341626.1 hypothetical protein [Actinomadura rupiterrae]
MTDEGINLVYRIAVAGGLRNLASLIERRMDLPVPRNVEISYSVIADSDEDARAEVDRIAGILGETPGYPYGDSHYIVTHDFGPVTYAAVAITREYMDRYRAEMEAEYSDPRKETGGSE